MWGRAREKDRRTEHKAGCHGFPLPVFPGSRQSEWLGFNHQIADLGTVLLPGTGNASGVSGGIVTADGLQVPYGSQVRQLSRPYSASLEFSSRLHPMYSCDMTAANSKVNPFYDR